MEHELLFNEEKSNEYINIKISVGDSVAVKLTAHLGTGFRWELITLTPGPLRLIQESIIESERKIKPGVPEIQLFVFSAQARGKQTLIFNYVRPWQRSNPSSNHIEVTITVL
jgi:predicted secreted protein